MKHPLTMALQVVLAVAARSGDLLPLTHIEFNEGDPGVGFDKLPGFADIEAPKMRLCCAIGWQPSNANFPALTATKPMGVGNLGSNTHEYGGPKITGLGSLFGDRPISRDPVGHLYTARGGIIDIGHVRDHADLARYCAVKVRELSPGGGAFQLSNEAGTRSVAIHTSGTAHPPEVCALLGARISYDFAIWHEIVTWAARNIPEKQEYSAFSPEDNYSNLLGAYLGYRAMIDQRPFNEALSQHLLSTMVRLGAVSRLVTEETIAYGTGHWFDYDDAANLELHRRHFGALGTVTPWLLTDVQRPGLENQLASIRGKVGYPVQPTPIVIPQSHPTVGDLSALYDIAIDVSVSIRPEVVNHLTTITDANFPAIIDRVKAEVLNRYPNGDTP